MPDTTNYFLLVDADGKIIGRRPTLGALRNYARLSNVGKAAVAIISPDGESLPVRKPQA